MLQLHATQLWQVFKCGHVAHFKVRIVKGRVREREREGDFEADRDGWLVCEADS